MRNFTMHTFLFLELYSICHQRQKNIGVNELCGSTFEVNVINFAARYGNYTRKSLIVIIHGAYSKYIDVMTDVKWINGLTGKNQIVPVTMFLVMLYNACFMFQQDKETNMLITALDTFELGADVDHEKFMNMLSEYKNLQQIPFWNTSFQTHMALKHLLNKSLFLYIHPTR
jgi:hypothetical protein